MPYRNIEKMPEDLSSRLVIFGGIFFAAIAGYVNLVLLEASRMTLSHMTGNVARLSEALYRGSEISTTHFLIILFSFILGAMLTGFLLADHHFGLRRVYGVLMLIEGLVLLSSGMVFASHVWWTVYLVSFAMGQQNAMVSSFKGLNIRTTHMTGVLTDLGFLLGSFIKRRRFIFWRVGFFMMLLVGFFIGGWFGLLGYQWLKIKSLYLSGGMLLLLGFGDIIYISNLRARGMLKK